jgi:D-arginine dehydrogenase
MSFVPHPAQVDVVVIGAGIAGAACAYEVAACRSVVLLERESQPGYHTTGRSAALYSRTYGNAPMRALTRASLAFLTSPPTNFTATPLLAPRGALLVARAEQLERLEALYVELQANEPGLQWLTGGEVIARAPIFATHQVAAAIYEAQASDIDVHALHHGYLRGFKARGGELRLDAEVTELAAEGSRWRIRCRGGDLLAGVVVNAAGAWADVVGAMAGAAPLELVAKRRTAITFDPPAGAEIAAWPAVIDVDETWYVKPEVGRLLASPADETPSPPCDAQPDELDIAVLVDRLENVTTLRVPRLRARWAGLRSFVADRTLVAGFDPDCAGFFWLAGQGGYGIQTAPTAARLAAALILGETVPELAAEGATAADFAPQRLRGVRSCKHAS